MVSVGKILLKIQKLEKEWRGYSAGDVVYIYANGQIVCNGKTEDLGREIVPRDIELWFGVRYRE